MCEQHVRSLLDKHTGCKQFIPEAFHPCVNNMCVHYWISIPGADLLSLSLKKMQAIFFYPLVDVVAGGFDKLFTGDLFKQFNIAI